tara:strand:- start:884 stop:1129 length:246 start_codon:yes stop_codon:yes gene_type:complete
MNHNITKVYEAISTILAIAASLYLSTMTNDSNMLIVFGCFFISSIAGVIAFRRRKLGWPLTLQYYFCFVNLFGITRTLGWL